MWAKPHHLVLDELGSRGELDWSRCAIDSVNMRALKRGPDRPESCRPGKYGSKIHLITERTGLPLSVGISGANLYDSQALNPPGERRTADPLPPRAAAQAGQAPRRQGLRLFSPAAMLTRTRHQAPHRPQGDRDLTAAGPPPLDHHVAEGLIGIEASRQQLGQGFCILLLDRLMRGCPVVAHLPAQRGHGVGPRPVCSRRRSGRPTASASVNGCGDCWCTRPYGSVVRRSGSR